jgi:hypothetical protein
MTDLKSTTTALESGMSLGFVVAAAFASALVWLWAMLGQMTLP